MSGTDPYLSDQDHLTEAALQPEKLIIHYAQLPFKWICILQF